MEKYSKEYHRVHYHLRVNYGKATKCEGEDCNGKSNKFEWALKHGHEYSNNPKDYLQLCKSCHSKYDRRKDYTVSELVRKKMSLSRMGMVPGNKGVDSRIIKICSHCKEKYKDYKDKRKTYCSIECRNNNMLNKPSRNKTGKNGRN